MFVCFEANVHVLCLRVYVFFVHFSGVAETRVGTRETGED